MSDDKLPVVMASLKLLQVLRNMVGKNDDLDEAWVEMQDQLFKILVNGILETARSELPSRKSSVVEVLTCIRTGCCPSTAEYMLYPAGKTTQGY